jgi:uncharacterized membrane protein YqjE
LIIVFVGGYAGKGLYLHLNKGKETAFQVLTTEEFYVTDYYFWVFGIASLVILFLVVATLRILLIILYKLGTYVCISTCHICCGIVDLEKGKSEIDMDRLILETKTNGKKS